MPLQKAVWLTTVLVGLLTSVLLVVSGYQGYGAVFFAVALAAAVNLR